MSWGEWYALYACMLGFYMLGLCHGLKRGTSRSLLYAAITAAVWPVFVVVGMWLSLTSRGKG